MLRPRLFHNIDARLKMLTCIIIENQGASFTCLILGCQRINERTRKRNHTPLAWQAFIHRAFKNSFCQLCLRWGLRAEKRFAHVINRRIARRVAILKNDSEFAIQSCWQNFRQDAQKIGFSGTLVTHQ
jgi:hypothetical protein